MNAHGDLYAVLEIAPDADTAEVQAAYYRMVRKHPPEKDAEGFQRVQAAYDVLSQPEARREYDQTAQTDPETRALIDQGRELLEKGDSEALAVIKRAVVRQPDAVVARDLLTQALLAAGQHPEALKQARKVLAQEPDNPTYAARVGDVLRAQDDDAEALPYYRKALLLDRVNPQNVVKLATLLNYLDQEVKAIELLEHSIQLDGRVDFDDFLFFQCLCRIYNVRGRYEQLEQTHSRIREILPPDPDTRSYVAWFYYVDALQMASAGHFEAAVRAIEEAASLDASLPDLQQTMERIKGSRTALDEMNKVKDDESIEAPLRGAAMSLAYQRTLGADDDVDKFFSNSAEALGRLIQTEGVDLVAQTLLLERRYPALAAVVSDLLDHVKEAARTAPKLFVRLRCPNCGTLGMTERPSGPHALARTIFTCNACQTQFNGLGQRATATAAGGSDCFVVTAACGDPLARPVRVLRAYRDQVLARRRWGALLIALYLRIGPLMAAPLRSCEPLRRAAFRAVDHLACRIGRRHPRLL